MKTRHLFIAATMVIAGAIAASGCSSSAAKPSATQAQSAPQAQSGSCSAMTAVKIAYSGNIIPDAQLLYAVNDGVFTKYCINATLNAPVANSSLQAQEVDLGQADFAVGGTNATIINAASGRGMQVIAGLNNSFPLDIVVSSKLAKDLEAKGVTAKSPLTDKIKALKGATIAGPATGSTTDVLLRNLLKQYGLNPNSDVTLHGLNDQASTLAAFTNGQANVMASVRGTLTTQPIHDGSGVLFVDGGVEDPTLATFPSNAVSTTQTYVKNNPKVVQEFLEALYDARAELKRGYSPKVMTQLKALIAPNLDQATYDATWTALLPVLTTGSMVPTQASFDVVLKLTNQITPTPISVTFDQAVNTSIMAAIEKAKG